MSTPPNTAATVAGMLRSWLGFGAAATEPMYRRESGVPAPPTRGGEVLFSTQQAAVLDDVFRALQVLTTAAFQLPIVEEDAAGRRVAQPSALVRRPCLSMSRPEWVSELVLSLAGWGQAFIYLDRGPDGDSVLDLELWHPADVVVELEPIPAGARPTQRRRRWAHYAGRRYLIQQGVHRGDVLQLTFLKLPGAANGIGPVEAARRGLSTTDSMTRYVGEWWSSSPGRVNLTTEQELTPDQSTAVKRIYNGRDPRTGDPVDQSDNPAGVRVLHKGTKAEHDLLKPADVMWLDAQRFSSVKVARVFGVPPSLMAVAVEGGSRTYANVEQEWIAFVRFTLMAYLIPIEQALSEVTVRGRAARFNLEGLLRSDTLTRYQAHDLAITAGIYDAAHAAHIEGLPAPAPRPALTESATHG